MATKQKPKRFEDFEEFNQAIDRLRRLELQVQQLEKELEQRKDSMRRRAEAMVQATYEGKPAPAIEVRAADVIADDIEVTRRAVKLADAGLQEVRRKISKQVCESLLPEHRSIVQAMAAAVVDAAAKAEAEQRFREELNNAGISADSFLPDGSFYKLGGINHIGSPVNMLVSGLIEVGHLRGNEAFLRDAGYDPKKFFN